MPDAIFDAAIKSPFLSVILPTFNAGDVVSKALDSVLSQTFVNYEVLVIDGKSSDGSVAIVKEYAEKHPQIKWVSEKDDGIYDAMNKGIRRAKGEWLYFLGSDDTLHDNDVFADVVRLIDCGKETKMIYGDVKLNRPIGYHFDGLVYAGKFDGDELLRKNICHQAIFYRGSLFAECGLYRTEYKIFADYDFNLRCFGKARPQYINRIVANFNLEGSSNTLQNSDTLFPEKFLENMAVNYAYTFKSSFFAGRKKELLDLLLKNLRSFKIKASLKIGRILAYQYLANKKTKATNPTHQTV